MQQLEDFQLELGQSSEVGMIIILGLMMFSVALGLRGEHFRFFSTQPMVYFGGVAAQIVGLPLLTLGLVFLFGPVPSVALGMILVSCCPGGNVSNLLVVLAKGNAALSVSMTATSSLAAAFVTPISIVFWCSLYPPTNNLLTQIDFDKSAFFVQTSLILILPIISGMAVAKWLPRMARRIQPTLITLSSLGLLLITVLTVLKYSEQFIIVAFPLLGLVALHNAAAFTLGFLSAKITGADGPSVRAITFEVGIQNAGLGIVILLTQLGGLGGAAAVAGLWGVWHIIGGLTLVVLFRRNEIKNRGV